MVLNKRIHYADEDFDPKQVDVLMADELNKLSFNCRESINEEIHGVCSLAIEETPEKVAMSLEQLAGVIEKIPAADKQGYLQSQQLFPNNRYVNDRNFRLMFLRCELFHVKRAAWRLVRHLNFVLEIFDDNKELLQRPIRLTDLAPRSMKLLRSGCFQLLPVRDTSGRRIFAVTSFKSHYEVIDRIQLYLYFQTVLSEDIDNQKNGFVSLGLVGENHTSVTKLPSKKDRFRLARYIESAPVRFCAIHSCHPDTPIFRLIRAAYSLGLHTSESTKYRLRFHIGTVTETQYLLMSYGIPVDQLPMTSSGRAKVGSLHQWLNFRTVIEKQRIDSGVIFAEDVSSNIIECPCLNDVALRPGKAYLCHPGNVRFKELLDKYMDEHAAANRRGKDVISWSIIEEIERSNGRFLEWNNKSAMWIQNKDRNVIRTRIPIYFRDHKRNVRAKRQRQNQLNVALDSFDRPEGPIQSVDPLQSYEKKRKLMNEDKTFKCCMNANFF